MHHTYLCSLYKWNYSKTAKLCKNKKPYVPHTIHIHPQHTWSNTYNTYGNRREETFHLSDERWCSYSLITGNLGKVIIRYIEVGLPYPWAHWYSNGSSSCKIPAWLWFNIIPCHCKRSANKIHNLYKSEIIFSLLIVIFRTTLSTHLKDSTRKALFTTIILPMTTPTKAAYYTC